MKKKLKKVFLCATMLMLSLALFTGCAKKLTIDFPFGQRTGTYEGDLQDGVPNGHGKFTTKNADGDGWYYEGEWKDGHFNGEGATVWDSGQVERGTYENDELVPLSAEESQKLFITPKEYLSHCVTLYGKIFAGPDYYENVFQLMLYGDPQNYGKMFYVYYNTGEEAFDQGLQQGDVIKITGILDNAVDKDGNFVDMPFVPVIGAKSIEKVDYTEAFSKALKTAEKTQSKTQYGYQIKIDRVEFAESETRVYMTVVNQGSGEFSVGTYGAKMIKDGVQYETQSNFTANYPQLSSDIVPGVKSEGVLTFPGLPDLNGSVRFIFDTYADSSWENDEDLKPFEFTVEIPNE